MESEQLVRCFQHSIHGHTFSALMSPLDMRVCLCKQLTNIRTETRQISGSKVYRQFFDVLFYIYRDTNMRRTMYPESPSGLTTDRAEWALNICSISCGEKPVPCAPLKRPGLCIITEAR